MKRFAKEFGLALVLGGLGGAQAACVPDTVVMPNGGGGASGDGGATTALGGGGTTLSQGGGGGCPTECCDTADCPSPQDECLEAVCDQGVCASVGVAPGKALAQQTQGDCMKAICGPSGSKTTQVDDGDTPDDGNDCTVESCVAGIPLTAPASAGDGCINVGGSVCDGSGSCVECVTDAQCGDMEKPSCVGKVCVSPSCIDSAKNGDETDVDCGGSCAPCADGKGCVSGVDCFSKVCAGSVCQVPTCADGQKNGSESDLDCGGSCGATCPPNAACNSVADCVGSQCSGTPGFCVPNCVDHAKNGQETDVDCGGGACVACKIGKACGNQDLNCESGAYCASGTCAAKLPNGSICLASSQCASGACADGVCCNTMCTGTCMACNLAGSVGACASIPNGQDPVNECAGGACNGGGVCKLDNGQACGASSSCLSGSCKDGVCCNSSCSGLCAACNVAGNVGVCSNIPNGQDPASECSGATTCNGAGACTKLSNGTSCSADIQCQSGHCVDGVCCNTACDTPCYACSVAANGSTNGTCTSITAGKTDSSPACNGESACNESAVCEPKHCVFYVGSNYGGSALDVYSGEAYPDLHAVGFGDKLSSSQCFGGAKVQLWLDKNYLNSTWILSGNVPTYHIGAYANLGDNASSLKVF